MGNTKEARLKAANDLVSIIQNHKFGEGEKLNIVAHSHGGNVAFKASEMMAKEGAPGRIIDVLVTLGTPIRPDYRPAEGQVETLINVFSTKDKVQTKGGGESGSLAGAMFYKSAGRTLDREGVQDVDATKLASGHSKLWQDTATWKQAVSPRLPQKGEPDE